MNDLLSYVSGFEVRCGDQNKLPFIGYVELKVSLISNTNPDVIVLFLVTPTLDHPILGTHAITLLTDKLPHYVLSLAFKQTLPNKIHTVTTQLILYKKRENHLFL